MNKKINNSQQTKQPFQKDSGDVLVKSLKRSGGLDKVKTADIQEKVLKEVLGEHHAISLHERSGIAIHSTLGEQIMLINKTIQKTCELMEEDFRKKYYICLVCQVPMKHLSGVHTFECPKCGKREWYPQRIGDISTEELLKQKDAEWKKAVNNLLDVMSEERGGMLNRISIIDYVYRLLRKMGVE